MKTLFQRMAPSCLCAAALTLTATGAMAGNGSLFSSDAGLFSAAAHKVAEEIPSAQVFLASSRGRYNESDLNCMAEAIYHEARGESTRGQAAVAEVILNRVESRQFPSSVCAVINQPSQFSYTIGGRKAISNKAAYLRARDIARNALAGAPRVLTGGATYFHTPAVRPSWSHRFQRTVQIGQHIFYRPGGQRVASN